MEVDRAYTDIASATNSRTLGLFTTNNPIQNGETWYQNGLKYQGFRQFYSFTSAGNIPHGINTSNIFAFTKIYGTFLNNTGTWYPLPYVDAASATSQVAVAVTSTDIAIVAGAGAPPITQGYVVLEWLSQS